MPISNDCFVNESAKAIPLYLIEKDLAQNWLLQQSSVVQNVAAQNGWNGALGQTLIVCDGAGAVILAVIGYGTKDARVRKRFGALSNVGNLPKGQYALQHNAQGVDRAEFVLGWALSKYRFDRYKTKQAFEAQLVAPADLDVSRILTIAQGEALTRDLINTPASDMGPSELQMAVEELAAQFGAECNVIVGDELLVQNFPMIHAVGRASPRAPRLIELNWGNTGPRLTLVGKGVCFDTGGLNIKPGSSMGLMKKDMGGAAHVLGLAHMIMAKNMDVQLRVLIPAVENAVGGSAFRPQDVLTSRAGLTVEVNNTDAEGRLVLADALALANETPPDVMICMATLTGAARVAVGPDIAPFFTDSPVLAAAVADSAQRVHDPVWQLPFHAPYETMIEPDIADLDNAPASGFAGAITAALFLRRFVPDTPQFMHFDCYGWQPSKAPARSKGGAAQGIRALFDALPNMMARDA